MSRSSRPDPGTTTFEVTNARRPVRRRGRTRTTFALVAVAAAAASGIWYQANRTGSTPTTQRVRSTMQVAIDRRDMVVTTSQSGTLGYGSPFTVTEGGGTSGGDLSPNGGSGEATGAGTGVTPVVYQAESTAAQPGSGQGGQGDQSDQSTPTTARTSTTTAPNATTPTTTTATTTTAAPRTTGGTLTSVAASGALLARGEPIYTVDSLPRVLLYGLVPAWRELSTTATAGDDVTQLEENLVALGFDPDRWITIDTTFDWATSAAVLRWQAASGFDQTGAVALGQVVFLPGPARVGNAKAQVGATIRSGSPVTELTPISTVTTTFGADGSPVETAASRRVVTTTMAVSDRGKMKVGDPARIELTDGTTASATVATVGEVATRPASGRGSATVEVTLTLDDDTTSSDLVSAPVTILLPNQTEKDALVVPTTALIALKEGGYAIEVVKPEGGTRLVGVTPGLYVDSHVAITGDGLQEGTKVVVST